MLESRQLLVLTGGHKQRWLCETENAAHVARLANRNSRLILETWDKMCQLNLPANSCENFNFLVLKSLKERDYTIYIYIPFQCETLFVTHLTDVILHDVQYS